MQGCEVEMLETYVDLGAMRMATEVSNCTHSCSNGDTCGSCFDKSFAMFEYAG